MHRRSRCGDVGEGDLSMLCADAILLFITES